MKRTSFIKGAIILASASLISRILGAVYRIPLTRLIGDEGMGLFQMSYPVYSLVVTLAVAGIPIAISKLVAEAAATGSKKQVFRVFLTALTILIPMGAVGSVVLYIGAPIIAGNLLPDSRTYYVLRSLAPAVILVCITSGFRGLFMGLQNMLPNAISQVIEQIGRISTMLALAYLLLPKGLEYATSGIALGSVIGNFLGLLALLFFFFFSDKTVKEPIKPEGVNSVPRTTIGLILKLFSLSIPVALGGIVMSVSHTLDASIVPSRLMVAGYSTSEATALYGQLSGIAYLLVGFPTIITGALGASLVPAISEAIAINNIQLVRRRTHQGMRIALMVGLPASAGLYVLARPLTTALFAIPEAAIPLSALAFSSVFICLTQTCAAIFQGMGKMHIPVFHLGIGACVRLALTYILAAQPGVGILGAAIAATIGIGCQAALGASTLAKMLDIKFDKINGLLKPAIGIILMIAVIQISYILSYMSINSNSISTAIAFVLSAVTYFMVLLLTRAIKQRDIELLPMIGPILGRILKFLKLVN